jgi:beta-fructofuranosidase
MLLTARASAGADELDRGVVGLAVSDDLESWRAAPALSAAGAGFSHLEVPQIIEIDGHRVLLFSCDTPALAGARLEAGESGGIWWVELGSGDADEAIHVPSASLLVDDSLYAGRAVRDRDGTWVLLAFNNVSDSGGFLGGVTDPMPLSWSDSEGLQLRVPAGADR